MLPGYACVVARRHVEEPFQLPDGEMAAFWRESMAVARALSSLLEPRKMNYEIHGNSIPHLHLHLYPRFPGDPFEGRPIDMDAPAFTRTEKKYVFGFFFSAVPLFLIGCAAGWLLVPHIVELMTGFAGTQDATLIDAPYPTCPSWTIVLWL